MVSTGNAVWDAVKTALTDKVVGPTAITGVVLVCRASRPRLGIWMLLVAARGH